MIARFLVFVLVASLLTAVPARAYGDPSVPLPDVPSTPVTSQTMQPRPPDQATTSALRGNQPPATSTPDGGGTATATPLSPSASWQVSPHTGDFSWSYPLRVPPSPGGLAPQLALTYSSSSVDGRTSATNNQASWVGEGWDLTVGFVERTYGSCVDDGQAGKGDLCWRSDNATAAYKGGGGMLILDPVHGWRAKSDDGARIERLAGAGNGDDNGEHWRVTAVDGTQYFFGSRPESNSTWTVPVFGDDAGEPCHAVQVCTQAWRWNLDKIVDRNGNTILYQYDTETHRYGAQARQYVRGGTVRAIEYGPATGRVEFTTADRCVPGSECVAARKENWPDVAWEDPATVTPTFWSTKRLASITTFVKRSNGFAPVDTWTLEHQFPDPGDSEKPSLWLRSITHAGLPPVVFEGTRMPNRVYRVDGLAPLNRYRITGIVSESGGVISVVYAPPQCDLPVNPESNTNRCFPALWSKRDFTERTDYFHKYVVASVVQSDRFAGMNDQVTSYEYLDGAAWHHDTSEFTKPEKRTWNEFRGFGRVRVRTGVATDPAGPVGMSEQRFHRGMHGDKLPGGATRTVTVDGRTDHDWLAGFGYYQAVHLGQSETVTSKTLTAPVWQGPTASRGEYHAYIVRPGQTQTHTALAAGGWRVVRKTMTYDDRGQVATIDQDGERTEISYARNLDRWILNLPNRTVTTAPGGQTIVDNRAEFDANGNVTQTSVMGVVTSTMLVDTHGRVTEVTDALGNKTETVYTGAPVTQIATKNPLGHTTTQTLDPAWGVPTMVVDPNGRRTETAYDALGRAVEVWLPNRKRANGGGSAKYAYLIRNDGPSVVTTSRINARGNYLVTKQLYDGLLRPRQTQAPAAGGGRLLTDIRYDSQGREHRTTTPYFHNAAIDDTLWVPSDVETQGQTVTYYDGAGRTAAQAFKGGGVEKWRTTFEHGGDRVRLIPPTGGIETTTVTDTRGRTIELHQGPDVTHYAYTSAGHLESVTDPAGNVWRYEYDALGRKIVADDVDRGRSTMTYDNAGQLLTVGDARGVTLSYLYDALGRKTSVKHGAATLAEWTYDTAAFGKGLPATSTRFAGGAAYTKKVLSYNQLNKPLETEVTIPEPESLLSGTYRYGTGYNPDGSTASVTLPALGGLPGETVNHSYDELGLPTTTSGGYDGQTFDYVTGSIYTRYGEPARLQLGDDGKRVWQSFYYEEHTRRLARSIVDAEVPSPMQLDVRYTYDDTGNVKSADGQCFEYDHLQRLTRVSNCTGGTTATYTYDKTGNRLTDAARTYSYAAHRLLSVTTGAQVDRYEYDAVGNMTVRPGQRMEWDAEGHLARLTASDGDTTFVYDADGNRLVKRTPTTSTLYLDGQELTLTRASGALTPTRYYGHGGRTVAVRTGGRLTWLTQDHQGTAQAAIAGDTLQVNIRRLTPFGEPRSGGGIPGDKGFVGGTVDAHGLTHLGAREYDPALGRFISVDPIMDMADPQQFNGYAYANNSPVTKSDPSGLLWGWLSSLIKGVVQVVQQVVAAVTKRRSAGCDGRPRCAHPSTNDSKPGLNTNLCSIVDCRDRRASTGRRMLLENWLGGNITPKFIGSVRQYSEEAGIDPQLLLAILITESGDPHGVDPRTGEDKTDGRFGVRSVGLANMQVGAFGKAKANSRGAIDYDWEDTFGLSDEGNILRSTKAAAYYLRHIEKRLDTFNLGKPLNKTVSRPELVRIGYNMGVGSPGNNLDEDWMLNVAKLDRFPRGDPARIIDDFREAWRASGDLLAAAG